MTAKRKKRVSKRTKTNREEKGFNDLLLPIIAAILCIPFVVYLKVYRTGLGAYDFYPDMDISYDFYSYYRSRCFVIIMAVALVILLFYFLLYKRERRSIKQFWPLGIFILLMGMSTIASVDKNLSLRGSVNANQSLWVVFGYLVLLVYTYEMMRTEHDFKLVLYALGILVVIMGVIGLLQITGNDLLDFEQVQRLCMNREDEVQYLSKVGNTFSDYYVYLTLFNPNYAALALAMGIAFSFGMLLTCSRDAKKELVVYSVCLLLLVVLLYFTFSRMGILAAVSGIFAGVFMRGMKKGTLMKAGIMLALAVLMLVILDAGKGFKFYHRLTDEKIEEKLTDIVTDADGVHLFYMGQEEELTFESAGRDSSIFQGEGTVTLKGQGDARQIVVDLCDQEWRFGYEKGSYFYLNPFGKRQVLQRVEKWNLHGLESFASGRGYFWSRILPKLKHHILIGSGVDTTIVVFPQDDYAGRLNYSKDLTMICDRPHSGYLQTALETGVCGLMSVLVFLVMAMKGMITDYRLLFARERPKADSPNRKMSERMGYSSLLACVTYLVGLLTNDITIFVMPLACVFGGMAMAAAQMNRTEKKEK